MDIPKIQTDSKEDIHFLISQLQNAANDATAQHFASNPADESTQSQVQKLMSQVSISLVVMQWSIWPNLEANGF
jgi:hypothetical protein